MQRLPMKHEGLQPSSMLKLTTPRQHPTLPWSKLHTLKQLPFQPMQRRLEILLNGPRQIRAGIVRGSPDVLSLGFGHRRLQMEQLIQ